MQCALTALVLPVAMAMASGPAGMSPEAKALLEKRTQLKKTVIDPLEQQIEQRRVALTQEVDLKDLRFYLEKAQREYDARMSGDAEIAAAKKAKADAEKALPEAIRNRLATHPRLALIEKEISQVEAMRPQLIAQRREAMEQLSAIRREAMGSEAVQQARQASDAAARAFIDLPRTHPSFVAARQAVENAQKALDERIKALPETKALADAKKALAVMLREGPEIAQARKAREEARKAYNAKLEEAIRTSEKGSAVYKQLDELDQRQVEGEAHLYALKDEQREVRKTVEKEDPQILAARQAAQQAATKYAETVKLRASAEERALADARQAFQERLNSKIATDVMLLELRDRLDRANREMAQLMQQFKELRGAGRSGPRPKDGDRPRDREKPRPKDKEKFKSKRDKSHKRPNRGDETTK